MAYCKDRVQEVAAIMGDRLMKIQKYFEGAEIYEAVGYFERAIQGFVQAKKFDRAIECASQVKPRELQNMLIEKIQNEKTLNLILKNY